MNHSATSFSFACCLAFAGCASTHTVKLAVLKKESNQPIASATAVLQRRDYSIFNSKQMTEEAPISVDAKGNVVVVGVRNKDTIMVTAPGFSSALVGIHDEHTLSCYTPYPESGRPFPSAITTNISSVMLVPLELKKAP